MAKNVKTIREARGYTQGRLGYLLGMSEKYVSNVEQGTVNITLGNLEALATGLACTVEDLVRRHTAKVWLRADERAVEVRRANLRPVRPHPWREEHAWAFLRALGGSANIQSVNLYATCLHLSVADQDKIDVETVKRLGAREVVRGSADTLLAVLGPRAEQAVTTIQRLLALTASARHSLSDGDEARLKSAPLRLHAEPGG